MAVHIRSNYPDFFDSLLAAIDTVYIQSRDLQATDAGYLKIFKVKSSDRQFENVSGVSGFPTMQQVGESEEIPLLAIAQLYDKKFTHLKYAAAWQVSEEMQDDDQFEIVSSFARAFTRSAKFTKEVDLANVLNNSATATEKSADGSNIAANHTLWDGSTKNNSASTDFGVAAAQTMFNHFATLTDDRGLRVKFSPKYVLANPSMKWVIKETMGSEYKPFVTTNEINALNDETLTPIYWAELTDTDAWYVSTDPSDLDGNGLRLYNRQQFTTSQDFDVKNLTLISVGRQRWSRGCIDWRQVYCSAGA